MSEHPRIAAFRETLRDAGATGEVRVLPESAHTAALAAAALGCEVGAIANSLIFAAIPAESPDRARADLAEDADPTPVLLLTSGAHRVDTAKVAATLGLLRLDRADKDFVKHHTGQIIGGVSPIGHPRPVPTYLDPALAAYDVIWAAAGHPAAIFSTTYDELRRLTGATELAVN